MAESPMGFDAAEDVIAIAHAEHIEDLRLAKSTDKWTPAVEYLRSYIPVMVRRKIRNLVAEKSRDWPHAYHTYWGMGVRNALRENGFYEDAWPVHNLDNIYVELVEEACR